MTAPTMTHQGYIVGNNSTVAKGFKQLVKLRETKLHWIDHTGSKWSKRWRGNPAGAYRDRTSSWPPFRLDLDSIKELPPRPSAAQSLT